MERRVAEQEHEGYDLYTARPGNLHPLSALKDWHLDHSEQDVRGLTLKDREGNDAGKVEDLLVDTKSYVVPFAVVGGIPGIEKQKLIPLDRLEADQEHKVVHFDRSLEDLRRSPDHTLDIKDYGSFYDHWSGLREEREEQPKAREGIRERLEEFIKPKARVEEVEAREHMAMPRFKRTVTRIIRRPHEAGHDVLTGEILAEEVTIEEELAEEEMPAIAAKRGEAAFEEEQKKPAE